MCTQNGSALPVLTLAIAARLVVGATIAADAAVLWIGVKVHITATCIFVNAGPVGAKPLFWATLIQGAARAVVAEATPPDGIAGLVATHRLWRTLRNWTTCPIGLPPLTASAKAGAGAYEGTHC